MGGAPIRSVTRRVHRERGPHAAVTLRIGAAPDSTASLVSEKKSWEKWKISNSIKIQRVIIGKSIKI